MSDNSKPKMELTDINFKRAAINISHSIIDKIEMTKTPEELEKQMEYASNDFLRLLENYKIEKSK
ncbi:MAG: hypothetical protein A2086_01545 [Spirochaetes bacterium GWD1_27_9]|nr:MAG: hypothetical protein A2Z98_08900 [Spirochaetes bacterium GWB1_27_13]OHD28065.1 MAG: hypothetical protein A2Y34_02665 [Spirochaetes bacterium GWC1_27_15]OHD41759.1 MAG: hypothetical protein A2086_01545 [Spirochaetes bacterium GWD1_27_9]